MIIESTILITRTITTGMIAKITTTGSGWADRHVEYRDFNRLKQREQREYWKWRHEHEEHEEHEHHD